MIGIISKADLQVHSKYSDNPREWFLRRIGSSESFTEPKYIYDTAHAMGMDFVTITDHNTINGSLDIAHLPGTFISSEITTIFPETQCKIHCLVHGITEVEFKDLQGVRENVYDFRKYLLDNNIVYSIAHPFYAVNDSLTIDIIEKMLVLFDRFEAINGARPEVSENLTKIILNSMTPERLQEYANKHDIQPISDDSWNKMLTGGSDDHGGLYIGAGWTETPYAKTTDDFLNFLRDGEHSPKGSPSNSLKMANTFLKITSDYYGSRFRSPNENLIASLLKKFTDTKTETEKKNKFKVLAERIAAPFVWQKHAKQMSDTEKLIFTEIIDIVSDKENNSDRKLLKDTLEPAEYKYVMISQVAHQLLYKFSCQIAKKIKAGSIMGILESLSSVGAISLGLTPYIAAFLAQHKGDRELRKFAAKFDDSGVLSDKNRSKAWVTDTFNEINGVTRTIKTLANLAYENKLDLTLVTCVDEYTEEKIPIKNFEPIGTWCFDEYTSQVLSFPPFLDVIRYFEEQNFDEIIISTPGPMGITALAAAYILEIPITGIYHTDFPMYVMNWTEDPLMRELTARYMKTFYGNMQRILVPTEVYRTNLVEMDFAREMIDVMPRGVDLSKFNKEYRSEHFWQAFDLDNKFTFIYVGRISSEKNIKVLFEAFDLFIANGGEANLALIGDGPGDDFDEYKKKYKRNKNIKFTGKLNGELLSKAYASADALVFPSLTDTFGNVVLEAHASAIPAIVSTQGGPQEIIRTNQTGLVVDCDTPKGFAKAMTRFVNDNEFYLSCKNKTQECAQHYTWDRVLEILMKF
ncbi:MAG: glycosyltransferase [Kiritimatiellae bacterium]|jgi:glycosyltransferase involved in cell wall biosynthesis|nr:glycosyltransferase [Kiritimatiellia bacterium]